MKLISQWWTPGDEERLAELEFCKKKNESIFDECVYLNGSGGSLNFRDLFSHAKDGELCVVANTDVWFDDTIDTLRRLVEPNVFAALTRWQSGSGPNMSGWPIAEDTFHDISFFSGSQDAWAFVGCDRVRQVPDVPLGITGCDQIVAGWAAVEKFYVIDPALSVKCWHEHRKRNEGDLKMATGFYGYPHLTTEDVTGLVATHFWSGDGKKEWSVIECRR